MYNIAHRTLLYKELLEYVESFGGFKGKLQQARVGFVLLYLLLQDAYYNSTAVVCLT